MGVVIPFPTRKAVRGKHLTKNLLVELFELRERLERRGLSFKSHCRYEKLKDRFEKYGVTSEAQAWFDKAVGNTR